MSSMRVELGSVASYVDQINSSCLAMHYKKLNNGIPFVLVEGETDRMFYQNVLAEGISIVPVGATLNAFKKYNRNGIVVTNANCKEAIASYIYGNTVIPDTIYQGKDKQPWRVYGIIDRDFDDDMGEFKLAVQLLLTDTHDLETMLLMTDESVLTAIEGCILKDDEISIAEGLAYEMSILRQEINLYAKPHLKLKLFVGKDGLVDFSAFVSGKDINIKLAVHYINNRNGNIMSLGDEKKVVSSIVSANRRNVTSDSTFSFNSNGTFEPLYYPEFWYNVNGHDVLSALVHINDEAKKRYSADGNYFGLNRAFEKDLIRYYQYKSFHKTTLSKKMESEKLLKEID